MKKKKTEQRKRGGVLGPLPVALVDVQIKYVCIQGHTGEAVQPAAGLGVTNQQQAAQPYLRLFLTAHRSGWQHETRLARINSQQPAASSGHLATGRVVIDPTLTTGENDKRFCLASAA
ncbi:predicted protein [Histoplasma capsulatum var. duboisii H88]|uniref:Predicted protein n=1 Tax=Ajellomyces capsulatus (strain H88) TaxID=544711 RepID=F0ULR7_AJEC8|nr:predicted protein [Histoplasma capsulatum var. duboisii H88]